MKNCLLIVAGLFAITTLDAQSLKQGIKLQKGQQYEVTTASTGSMAQAGMTMPIETSLVSILTIKNETEKGYTATSLNKRFIFKSNAMGQEMNFDSDDKTPGDGPMVENFKDIKGKTDSFTVDKNGYIMVSKSDVKTEKETNSGAMGMSMGMPININGGSNSYPMFNLLPRYKEIAVGESITDSTATKDAEGNEKTVTTYTIDEIKDGKVNISIVGTVTSDRTSNVEQMGMQMSITTNNVASNKGKMVIDQATGLLVSKTIDTAIEGTMSINGMSLPVNGNTTTVTTVKLLP